MSDRATLPPDDPRHGTSNGYTHHACRCSRCREFQRLNQRAHRESDRAKLTLRAQSKAAGAAVAWVRRCHPDVLEEARVAVGLPERNP